MNDYNPHEQIGYESDKKYKRDATLAHPQSITTQSGEYKLYPSGHSDTNPSINIYRVDRQHIPPKHQEFLEQFVHRRDTWVATLVPADHSRYVIGLQRRAIERDTYTEIVDEIVETL